MEVGKVDLNKEKLPKMQEILGRHGGQKGGLVSILHDVNSAFTYLPEDCLRYVSYEMQVPLSMIYHIATFYHAFRLTPIGKYLITICKGTTCHVKGAPKIIDAFERELAVKMDETTKDRLFTIGEALCLGCCGLAPVVKINEEFYGGVTIKDVSKIIGDYRAKEAAHGKA
ncbi:MAG: NAD(P)H-dependent oxidoreductase subunit E [Candidatus Eremiobacteraeota bacterium]|nr:NAD(P)H-dependent oxidoreductase subunit E [Candidatus Eremiobacteraeota bacterium]